MPDIPISLITDSDSALSPDFIEPYLSRSRCELWLMVREGRRFILKGLPATLRSHPEEVARLRKEYSLGLRVNHPSVAGIYGFEHTELTGPVIVMEYVDGTSLDEYLAGNPPAAERLRVASRIADALADIHSLGIAHRDLKPDNVLVTRRRAEPKIIDFSLADGADSVIYKKSLGTAEFGAPEQQMPDESDSAADVYSFGRLLELLLPGRRYKSLRQACLAAEPGSRPSIEQVAEQLDVLAGKRRSHAGLYILAAIAIAALCAIGVLLLKNPRTLRTQSAPSSQSAPDSIAPIAPIAPSAPDSIAQSSQSAPIAPATAPAAEPEPLKAILQKYIDKVDEVIAQAGRIPYTGAPVEELNSRRNDRTRHTYAIAAEAEQALKEAGATTLDVDQLMYTYWWHVSNCINRTDGVNELVDSIMNLPAGGSD